MSPREFVRGVSDWTESPVFKLGGPVLSGAVLAMLAWVGSNLIQHGETLSRITEAVDTLKAGQNRIEDKVADRIGQIVNVQQEQRSEIAAIREAQREFESRLSAPRGSR